MHLGPLSGIYLDVHRFVRRDYKNFEEDLAFRVKTEEAIKSVRLRRIFGRTEFTVLHVLDLEKWQHADC